MPHKELCLCCFLTVSCPINARRGGGTHIHYLYGYVPPNGVVILKLLVQNGVSISEAFSRTGYNISNARKLQFCKQPFEIIQGQTAFKNTVQCVNKQTVILLLHPGTEYKKLAHFQNGVSVLWRILERGIKNWPISRTGYHFQGKFGANLVSRAAHAHPKNTQVPPRYKCHFTKFDVLVFHLLRRRQGKTRLSYAAQRKK